MKIKTRDELLQALADGRSVLRADVSDRVRDMKVWGAGAGLPGCLFDSGPDYYASKRDAIEAALFMLDTGEGASRGACADLLRYGRAGERGAWQAVVWECTVEEVL